MNFIKVLTPKDTQEIKPGLFIQKTSSGYRQVSPPAWDGKVIWKNFFFGQGFLKSSFFFIVLMFLAWSYFHDVKVYREFYEEVIADPILFCSNISLVNVDINGLQNNNPLQNNFGETPKGILER